MANHVLELFRLKSILLARGLEESTADAVVAKAEREIEVAMASKMKAAEEELIGVGVEKGSAEFINELRPRPGAFAMETEGGGTDFTTPPFPMLPYLLKNAKPIKDGSGVYKVIPVGGDSKKPSMANNIFDAQKAQLVKQQEDLKAKTSRGSGSKPNFRTATSKQSSSERWVIPAKKSEFSEDLKRVNDDLSASVDELVQSIIRDYEENF